MGVDGAASAQRIMIDTGDALGTQILLALLNHRLMSDLPMVLTLWPKHAGLLRFIIMVRFFFGGGSGYNSLSFMNSTWLIPQAS